MENTGKTLGKTPDAADTPSHVAVADPNKKPFESFGQNVHKWGTYISIDWFLNYVTGVAFAMWATYHPVGKKYWSEPMTKGATWVSENVFRFKPGPALESSVKNVTMILSVIAGGMFTIPPLMVLENKKNRRAISKSLDEMYYGKEVVANDPKFEESYDAIDNAPKQGFWTGLTSRLAALAPCIATVYFETPKRLSKGYFDFVERNSMKVYNAVGLNQERLFKGLPAAEKESRWKVLHENSAIDFGLEPWYAVLHMITYRAFAGLADAWKPKTVAAPVQAPAPLPNMPATSEAAPQDKQAKHTKKTEIPTNQVQSVKEHHAPDRHTSHDVAVAH
jgi:hypothetical protein